MTIKERIEAALLELELEKLEIEVRYDGNALIAIVVSPEFGDMPEGERQAFVWGKLLESLSPKDDARLEFVFTYTPAEYAALLRESAA